MKEFLRNEFSGWRRAEVLWLAIAWAVITGLSIYGGDSLMGIISSVTGVACVVLTGKGKLSAYLFGLVNSVLYAIISYQATLYGETMLNALYYVPMQFVGFYVWSKNMDSDSHEVTKRRMAPKGFLHHSLLCCCHDRIGQNVCGAVVDLGRSGCVQRVYVVV